MMDFQKLIENAWGDRTLAINDVETQAAIRAVLDMLDKGELRVATPTPNGWEFHDWVRKAVLLYFLVRKKEVSDAGPLVFYDKLKLKRDYEKSDIRVVPPAAARYGSFLNTGVILMPSYVNIGAYIDSDSLIDIGAGIGSCAQIGKKVHISAGTIIGGVIEPIQASPVIIEDNVFIGANCTIVEGVKIEAGAVVGAGVHLTASTKIIDVTSSSPKEYKGKVPAQSIVIPGSTHKKYPAGSFNVSCGLIIGKRNKNTDAKVALNELLR